MHNEIHCWTTDYDENSLYSRIKFPVGQQKRVHYFECFTVEISLIEKLYVSRK